MFLCFKFLFSRQQFKENFKICEQGPKRILEKGRFVFFEYVMAERSKTETKNRKIPQKSFLARLHYINHDCKQQQRPQEMENTRPHLAVLG